MSAKSRLLCCVEDAKDSKEVRRVDEVWMREDFYRRLEAEGCLENGELYLQGRRVKVFFHEPHTLKLIQRGRIFQWRTAGQIEYAETGQINA